MSHPVVTFLLHLIDSGLLIVPSKSASTLSSSSTSSSSGCSSGSSSSSSTSQALTLTKRSKQKEPRLKLDETYPGMAKKVWAALDKHAVLTVGSVQRNATFCNALKAFFPDELVGLIAGYGQEVCLLPFNFDRHGKIIRNQAYCETEAAIIDLFGKADPDSRLLQDVVMLVHGRAVLKAEIFDKLMNEILDLTGYDVKPLEDAELNRRVAIFRAVATVLQDPEWTTLKDHQVQQYVRSDPSISMTIKGARRVLLTKIFGTYDGLLAGAAPIRASLSPKVVQASMHMKDAFDLQFGRRYRRAAASYLEVFALYCAVGDKNSAGNTLMKMTKMMTLSSRRGDRNLLEFLHYFVIAKELFLRHPVNMNGYAALLMTLGEHIDPADLSKNTLFRDLLLEAMQHKDKFTIKWQATLYALLAKTYLARKDSLTVGLLQACKAVRRFHGVLSLINNRRSQFKTSDFASAYPDTELNDFALCEGFIGVYNLLGKTAGGFSGPAVEQLSEIQLRGFYSIFADAPLSTTCIQERLLAIPVANRNKLAGSVGLSKAAHNLKLKLLAVDLSKDTLNILLEFINKDTNYKIQRSDREKLISLFVGTFCRVADYCVEHRLPEQLSELIEWRCLPLFDQVGQFAQKLEDYRETLSNIQFVAMQDVTDTTQDREPAGLGSADSTVSPTVGSRSVAGTTRGVKKRKHDATSER